jgi:plasmid rolling circle replication initiator protein Rep
MEERINLKPGNVENMKDWRDFLRKKTDSKFKVNKYQIQLYYVIIIIIQCIMPFHLRHKVINSKLLEVFKCHIQ